MNPLEERIRKFSKDPRIILETLAMLKVGRDKGDNAEEIISRITASILFRFHGIPLKTGQS
jgi:hypothetical protein